MDANCTSRNKKIYIPGSRPTCSNSFIIKNNSIFDVKGDLCKIISPYEAKIDDWKCTIEKKGLVCTYIQPLDSGNAMLRYVINRKGLSMLSLKLPGEKFVTLQKKWLCKPNNFDFSGIITLSNGGICQRMVSFNKLK